MFEGRARAVFFFLVGIAVVGGVWYGIERISEPEQDLTILDHLAATNNYQTLIEKVQSREVGPEGFHFVVMGDTRSNIDIATEVSQQVKAESPAFIFANGDIVRRGLAEEYLVHHEPILEVLDPIPLITAPGNHERGPGRRFDAFKYIYGDTQFSFDYGGCRFIGVNNSDWTGLGGDDLEYLDRELSKPGADYKFVTFHVPPAFLENAVESDDERGFERNADKLHELMQKHGVDHVFVGHVHGFATETIDGIPYTISGGAGANLTEALGAEGKVHNYVVVHVTPEGLKNEVVKRVNKVWEREAF